MPDKSALSNLRQAILSRVDLHGLDAAQKHYADAVSPLSVEGQRIQRVFAQLEQNEAGQWCFGEK